MCILAGFLIGSTLVAKENKSMLAGESELEAEGVKRRWEPKGDFDVHKSVH